MFQLIFFKYSIISSLEDGLINYWSFTNNVDDSIGTAHLYDGVNASLTHDRFGFDNSALRLKSGYYSVPPGVYFNGPFTTSVWVNAKSYTRYARVFDFSGNGPDTDNIVLGLFKDTPSVSFFSIAFGTGIYLYLDCNSTLALNEWTHLAVTFNGSQSNFYYNGIFCSSFFQYSPRNEVRNINYIGKSNWPQDPLADAVFDELRIYNRALDQSEILDLMNF